MLVLVVEDDSVTRSAMVRLLGMDGHEGIGANDAESAVALMQERLPAAILLDMMLPGMCGLTFVKHLRKDRRIRSIPVIGYSAVATLKGAALEAGVDAFLVKGTTDWVELIGTINALTESVA